MSKETPQENKFGSVPEAPKKRRLSEKLSRVLEADRKEPGVGGLGGLSPTVFEHADTNIELLRKLSKWITENKIDKEDIPPPLLFGAVEKDASKPGFCKEVFDWVRENKLAGNFSTEFNYGGTLWNIISTAYEQKVDVQLLKEALAWMLERAATEKRPLPEISSAEFLIETYQEAEMEPVPSGPTELFNKYRKFIEELKPDFDPTSIAAAHKELSEKNRRPHSEILAIITNHVLYPGSKK